MTITIRLATAADITAFRVLRLEALSTHPEVYGTDYETERDRSLEALTERMVNGNTFLAFVDDIAVGMAGIFRGNSSKTRHKGEIWGVYVQPAARRQGVAQHLVNACVAWACEQGMKWLSLAVLVNNQPAIACYERCGFTIYGVEPKAIYYNGVYYDEYVMLKNL
jgi:ribosomal protein S18 acetylase RimI-like enzyme